MKILTEKETELKNMIRDAIAINPSVSIRGMQRIIEHNTERTISDKYVSKLMYKLRREAVVQSDRKKLNERLAEVRERFRVIMHNLNMTIYWKTDFARTYGIDRPTFKEKLAAMKLLAHLETQLFRAEMAAGMYEDRKLAVEEMLKEGILPIELREQFVAVYKSWMVYSYKKEGQAQGFIPKPEGEFRAE